MISIISFILGILTVFLIGISVGMVMVIKRNLKYEREINSINLELIQLSNDLYQQIENTRTVASNQIENLERDVSITDDEIREKITTVERFLTSWVDSRIDKLENKLRQNKNLLLD